MNRKCYCRRMVLKRIVNYIFYLVKSASKSYSFIPVFLQKLSKNGFGTMRMNYAYVEMYSFSIIEDVVVSIHVTSA